MQARVTVTLKAGVLDPQGKAIEGALRAMGISGIDAVRQGKLFEVEIGATDRSLARATLTSACEQLLANTVIEDYRIELGGAAALKAAVVTFPGINRERDVARALKAASGRDAAMIWHADTDLPVGTDLVVLPGGFSYGDYLRCGAIAARAPIMAAVRAHAARGGFVLAICNGFQIACEAGLLPGVLVRNANLRFLCHFQHVRVERNDTPFTHHYAKGQAVRYCVAHGEGNYTADAETLARLEGEGLVAFRYCDAAGATGGQANPNGSEKNIAGVFSPGLNVLGLMPHPENLIDPLVGGTDGLALFESLTDAIAPAVAAAG